ncbi:phage portal protein [Streptomyces neyagawaensis]|uniref:phage portal protein n=1 Tax=Streptomyces neyagawaensis TaxID=42238 RepID=UPI0006E287E1|nr:phage portal protein [Streptomyces neyagawaensis]MCL6733298.1 phage portal protein [Streptomyces neyagawaensis]MDE1685100.1 phage portal protein [Streptomyces neyagawaensis]
MTSGLFGLFDGRTRRGLESPAQPLTSAALTEFLGGVQSDAGVQVSETTALRTPAVWRAVSLISGVSSALPLPTYKEGTRERQPFELLRNPHPDLTPVELWRFAYLYRVLWGNTYIQKIRDGAKQVRELWPVSSDRVQVDREKPSDSNPSGKWFYVTDDWGVTHVKTPYDILHIPGLGYDGLTGCSPVRLAAQGIGLAQAAEKSAARLFGSGNMVGGVLQTEQRLDQGQAEQLKARWKAKMSGVHNSHEIAVLDSGASFKPVQMPNTDAQFLESRQFQVTDIARMFGVPPFLLMSTEKSTSWGTGLEQQALGWVTFDLGPTWLTPTEQRITKELLPPSLYANYQMAGLLRGDSAARATFFRAMRDVGAFSANDIRALEELPPLAEHGDVYLQPMYMAPLGSNPLAPDGEQPAAGSNRARAAALMAEAQRLLQTPDDAEEGT